MLAHIGILQTYIYQFHMPLFFFISGFLYNNRTNLIELVKNKSKQLLVPYVTYLILIYSIQQYEYFKTSPVTSREIIMLVSRFFLGGRWLSSYTTVFWFITSLFFTQIIFHFLINKLQASLLKVFSIICLTFAYLNAIYLPNLRFPWAINSVLIAIPIFYCGYLYKNMVVTFNSILLSVLLSIFGIILIYRGYENYLDIKNTFYGIPLVTLISCISMIFLILYISDLFSKVLYLSGALREVGECSLVIMYLHQPIQILINQYLTTNKVIIFVACLGVSYLFYLVAGRFMLTRALFLGYKADFNKLVSLIKGQYQTL